MAIAAVLVGFSTLFSPFAMARSAAPTCLDFGDGGIGERRDCISPGSTSAAIPASVSIDGKVTWAIEIPGDGMALCDEGKSSLRFWSGGEGFTEIPLAPFKSPVGAVYLDGKIYIACFGAWPTPEGTSGIAVVDVKSRKLEATHAYSDERKHVHNVYAFDWQGKKEIFAAILGNPWLKPPLPGDGLARLNRESGAFLTSSVGQLSARSAKQGPDGTAYVLTQEPQGQATRLARLIQNPTTVGFTVTGSTTLPDRDGGDGGADILVGRHLDTVWATDRTAGAGKLYLYNLAMGGFTKVRELETGRNPRYTTVLENGDIVVCNQDDDTLTVFAGLADDPTSESVQQTTISTVKTVSFFLQTSSLSSSNGGSHAPTLISV